MRDGTARSAKYPPRRQPSDRFSARDLCSAATDRNGGDWPYPCKASSTLATRDFTKKTGAPWRAC